MRDRIVQSKEIRLHGTETGDSYPDSVTQRDRCRYASPGDHNRRAISVQTRKHIHCSKS